MSGVNSAGLSTTVLPVARAGAIFQASMSNGKFQGMICPTTPHAVVSGKFLMQQLGPSGVVIEVPGDQRNIDVAALADGLAVVHGLEHGEAAGMFLHGARQRVQVASSRVRSEGLPFWEGSSARHAPRRQCPRPIPGRPWRASRRSRDQWFRSIHLPPAVARRRR